MHAGIGYLYFVCGAPWPTKVDRLLLVRLTLKAASTRSPSPLPRRTSYIRCEGRIEKTANPGLPTRKDGGPVVDDYGDA